jgi:hypothetical protein
MNYWHRRKRRGASKGKENILSEIIAKKFPNLEKVMVIRYGKAFRTPKRQDQKRTSPAYIIAKTLGIQNKERILQAAREKCQIIYKDKFIHKILANF